MPIPFLYAICCEQIIKGGEWEALLLKLCNTMCRTSTLYYFMQKKTTLKTTQKIECALAGAHSRV